ncbi:3-hydroxybenzoate 6-hydroxylase 1 [Aquimixticola soesokkakensis]|uniref:3-hydroxybenzoate 6-hydroxylase 1 n=1 Tax=Aquimixticola soesokkakensis TaxID=1519096 RepID=A0A1Y5SQA3_9RHOB|nr:FAD-dependent oxidoreductase [Aquimixticola soesokkakensis]SLN44203.1 3-hydroxybenzoate 6-hydroxylase 1 [Aquimixticola soesokkakensis]
MLFGLDIAISGAGIAGLACARALALRGAKVTVYEQAPELGEVGAGLQISPNGVRVLDALGLDARARAVRSQGVRLIDGRSARGVINLDFARHLPGQDFLLMHRADLLDLLAEGARGVGVRIVTGNKVTAYTSDDLAVTLHFADGTTARHALAIGADGLHSDLRPMLNKSSTPFFTGQTAWRAVVPAIGGEPAEARLYMGAGRHLVTYPLRNGTQVNIVAVQEQAEWTPDSWSHEDDPAVLRAAFGGFAPEVQGLLARVARVHRWGLFRHPVARHWVGPRFALLGDAAHPTLPFLAQGAVMALEDGWSLATRLAALPMDEALAFYEAERRPRVIRVIEAANANARNYHLSGPKRQLAHTLLRGAGRFAPKAVVERFDWLYNFDPTA